MKESKTNLKLTSVESVKVATKENVVDILFDGGIAGKLTFLEENIFRYDVDPEGVFAPYATPRDEAHTAKIQQHPDESDAYTKPSARVLWQEDKFVVLCGDTSITWDKATAKMSVCIHGRIVLEEAEPLQIAEGEMIQILEKETGENFYGGGTQNGRFVHTGKKIQIVNESAWMDGGVASPNPFYYTTNGLSLIHI